MMPIVRPAAVMALAVAASASATVSLPAQARTAEPFAWEGEIAPGTTVEIKGVNGSIRATAGTGSTARVEAVRTGRRSDPAEVEIVVLEHANGVTVCAVYPSSLLGRSNECAPGSEGRLGARNNDVQVEFTVQVPASANLTARTTNGPVSAENVSGRVEAFSTNGDVRIEGGATAHARTTNGSVTIDTSGAAEARTTNGGITARVGSLDGSSPLRFSTTNGTISLTLPQGSNADIDASTSNGGIQSDIPITVLGQVRRNRLNGTIGAGGQSIELRTTNGRIQLDQAS